MDSVGMICVLLLMVVSIHRSSCDMLKSCGDVGSDERIKDSDSNKWFKWGQLYSYCKHRYNNSITRNSSSTFIHNSNRCSNIPECTQCMTVCSAQNKSLSCDHNKPCQDGCQFYNYLFNKTGDFKVDKQNLPHPNSSVIKTAPTNENISYSWERVDSYGDKKLPSFYLVIVNEKDKDRGSILGLVEAPVYTATTEDLCNHMYDKNRNKYKVQDLQFSLKVYPINLNGPSHVNEAMERNVSLTSSYTCPTKVAPLQNLANEPYSPTFAKNKDPKSKYPGCDYIIWHLRINDSRSISVMYKYSILSCPQQHDSYIKRINGYLGRVYRPSDVDGRALVRLYDPAAEDTLASCKIEIEASVKYGRCFLSDPFKKLIRYSNCSSVSNYSNICPYIPPTPTPKPIDTFCTNMTFNISDITCTNNTMGLCSDNTTVCEYCNNSTFTVNVVWEPYTKYAVNLYTVRYRIGDGVYKVRDGEKVSKEKTSFVIQIVFDEGYNQRMLRVQIHAETNHSKDTFGPVMFQSFESSILLRVDEPRPILTPTHATLHQSSQKAVITTVIAIVVVFVAIGVCIKIYRDRLQRRKKESHIQNGGIYKKDSQAEIAVISDEWEIYPESIDVKKKLGEGAFGTVYSARVDMSVISKSKFAKQCGGLALMSEKSKLVAVKFLKEGAGAEENKDFKDEITLMKGIGYHRNIVNMIGCSTIKQPLCLIVEYMHNGDLLHYLRKQRSKELNNQSGDPTENNISLSDIMSFAWQIACGMEYLASKSMVHRDLAARNILVSSDKTAKISDFGLSRQVINDPIYISNANRKIPIKWMSIEAIYHKEFTVQSDVWAYGVALFEIVTLGGTPYPSINNLELCKMLKSGYRMERPENCSVEMHDIMRHCWNEIPARRPTFTELKEHLEKIMEKGARYFSFEIDYSKPYYNVASFKSIPSDDEEETSLFTKEYDEMPTQVKVVDTVSIPVDESLQEKLESTEGNEGSVPARYISPHSLKSFTDIEKSVSFDNPSFHFHE